jgi:cell division protein FtsL
MKRIAIVACIVAAGLAIGVYRAKMGAEESESRIDQLQEDVRTVQEDISVLKAEEAYLSRPERIGPLARDHLGLEPTSPGQFTAEEALAARLGQERLALAPEPAPPSTEGEVLTTP